MQKFRHGVILGIGLLLVAGEAQAISRYNSMSMSCEAARAAIQQEGAVILRYTSKRVANLPLYGRYVRAGNQCANGEIAERATVPTADDAQCRVLICVMGDPDDGGDRFFPMRSR